MFMIRDFSYFFFNSMVFSGFDASHSACALSLLMSFFIHSIIAESSGRLFRVSASRESCILSARFMFISARRDNASFTSSVFRLSSCVVWSRRSIIEGIFAFPKNVDSRIAASICFPRLASHFLPSTIHSASSASKASIVSSFQFFRIDIFSENQDQFFERNNCPMNVRGIWRRSDFSKPLEMFSIQLLHYALSIRSFPSHPRSNIIFIDHNLLLTRDFEQSRGTGIVHRYGNHCNANEDRYHVSFLIGMNLT